MGRIEPVRLKGNDQEARVDGFSGRYQFASREIKVIYRLRDIEIGIGIEALHEIRTAVVQITFHLKIGVKSEAETARSSTAGKISPPWIDRS